MKKSLMILFVIATTTLASIGYTGVTSLRGEAELNAASNESQRMRLEEVRGGFARSYKQQPPMIPHNIDKDEISLKGNTCLNCHSETTFEAKKAPKAGDSHFVDREGNTTTSVSGGRWFCGQCHAPQMTASPLVQNTFEGNR